jgi:hypothetical protein
MKLSEYVPMMNDMYLFKGESGTGKTLAAASFPEPVYIASCDGRVSPLKYYPVIRDRDITFDIFTKYNLILEKFSELLTTCHYKTVVVDALMMYSRLVINHIINQRGGQTEITIKGEKQPLVVGGIPIMGINEYKGEASALSNMVLLLGALREKGVNVILTAHVIVSEQQQLGGTTRQSRRILTGGPQIAAEIPGYFDEVYHFYGGKDSFSGERKWFAITEGSGEDYARTAHYGLAREINFTDRLFYDKLVEAINNIEKKKQF